MRLGMMSHVFYSSARRATSAAIGCMSSPWNEWLMFLGLFFERGLCAKSRPTAGSFHTSYQRHSTHVTAPHLARTAGFAAFASLLVFHQTRHAFCENIVLWRNGSSRGRGNRFWSSRGDSLVGHAMQSSSNHPPAFAVNGRLQYQTGLWTIHEWKGNAKPVQVAHDGFLSRFGSEFSTAWRRREEVEALERQSHSFSGRIVGTGRDAHFVLGEVYLYRFDESEVDLNFLNLWDCLESSCLARLKAVNFFPVTFRNPEAVDTI